MKLEVGMYVRSKNGAIAKIEQIVDNEIHFNIKPIFSDGEEFGYNWLYIKEVIKASHNIIDLIQENDFVNGEKVSSIQYDGMGFEHIKCVQTICKFDDLDNRFYTETYFNKDIKSIVTKEQFEAIAYKVV